MSKPRAILHVTIRGQVQGVGYRAWVEYQAGARDLKAGSQPPRRQRRAVFAGAPKAVAEMVALCRHGPPSAKIEAVLKDTAEAEQLDLRRAGEAFSVLPTV